MKKIAKKLEAKGRKGDTILAHINPKEAAMLKRAGGSGSKNPKTGLLEFWGNDPEGNADAGRDNGTVGAEGQGGFGGPSGGPAMGGDYGYGQLSEAEKSQLANFAGVQGIPGGMMNNALGQFSNWYGTQPKTSQMMMGAFPALAGMLGRTGMGVVDPMAPTGNLGGGFGGGGSDGGGFLGGLLGGGQSVASAPAKQKLARPGFVSKWGKPRGLLGA